MNNIFEDKNKVKGNWVRWEKVGDSIQGTLTGKRTSINPASQQEQWVYEIMDDSGEFWNVGGKPAIDAQMRHIKLGQVIGFKYVEERPSKMAGKNPAKIIQVFAPAGMFNKEWLAQQEEERAAGLEPATGDELGGIDVSEAFETPEDVAKSSVNESTEKLNKIGNLAKEKLGVTNPSEVKNAVMEKTGVAFIDSNLDKIISVLEKM